MKKWQVGSLAAVGFGLFCGWYIASPWLTLYGIQVAAERRDVEALVGYVDFEALRANLKDQLHAAARRPPKTSSLPTGWSVPDRSSQLDSLDRQIDAFITPQTARAMLGRDGAPAPRLVVGIGDPSALARDIAIDRETLGRFVARGRQGRTDYGLIFTAHGFGWRLSGIRLPDSMSDRDTRALLGSASY